MKKTAIDVTIMQNGVAITTRRDYAMPRKTLYLSEAQLAIEDVSRKYKVPYINKFNGKWYEDMVYTDNLEHLADMFRRDGFRIV